MPVVFLIYSQYILSSTLYFIMICCVKKLVYCQFKSKLSVLKHILLLWRRKIKVIVK